MKFNGGMQVSIHVRPELMLVRGSQLREGDVIYSEWYGQQGGYEKNRYRIARVGKLYERDDGGTNWLLSGNYDETLKPYFDKFNALPDGCFSIDNTDGDCNFVGEYSKTWIVTDPELESYSWKRKFL